MTDSQLPSDRLSNLIKVATADAKRLYLERYDEYFPYFTNFHEPGIMQQYNDTTENVRCRICDAGAVIAGTLGGGPKTFLLPSDYYAQGETEKLRALDYVRTGALSYAHHLFYNEEATSSQRSEYAEMSMLITNTKFVGWHEFMRHIASLEVLAREMVSFENSWGIGGGAE